MVIATVSSFFFFWVVASVTASVVFSVVVSLTVSSETTLSFCSSDVSPAAVTPFPDEKAEIINPRQRTMPNCFITFLFISLSP